MAGVLRQIAVRGLFADVVLFIVAMALGGVQGNTGGAARPLVALVVLRDRLDGFCERFCHRWSPLLTERKRRAGTHRSRQFTTAMTEETLHLVLTGGRLALTLGLLLLPLLRALVGLVTAIEASRGGSQYAMMAGIMTGDAADHRTLDAALGLG